jgi:Double zinc ribbon
MDNEKARLGGAIMRRNSHPKKLMRTEGRIFIFLLQLLTAGAAFAQNTHPGPHSGSPYVVDGLALGARVDFESPIFRSYQCSPSEQFPQFTRCQRTQKQQIVGSRRSVDTTGSILHSSDGTAVYINRNISPGVFDRNEIQSEINRLSSKFGERALEMRMPQREGFPNAVIASWGKVQLEQLDANAVSLLASGQSPRKGLLIDYLGDLRRSAQLGLPIYSLNGGTGYLWSASIDRNGGGHLRFLTVDASALTPTRATQPPSGEAKEPEKIATQSATANAELAHVETERARIELPKDEIEKVTVAETANTDADAVENVATARGATFILISFLIITALLLLVWRAKARARRRQVYNSKIQLLNPATYPQGVHAPQGKLLEHESVASQDTSPEPIAAESELEKEISRPPPSKLQPCSHCNREISINDKFCMYCGASVAPKGSDESTRLCSSCRNQIGASDKFCRHCGASSIAVVAPSMISNEGDHEITAKRARATRKRTARRKAIRPQAESSQPDGKNANEEIGTISDPARTDVPKESSTAVLKA